MRSLSIGSASALLALSGIANAEVVGFTDNPTGNFAAWNAFASPLGDVGQTIDFDDHPLGPLVPDYYASRGVLLHHSGSGGDVAFGDGPGQNDDVGPFSEGEGPHTPSNYLRFGPGPASLIMTFDRPVFGAGMFLVGYFNPLGDNPVTISVYSGPDGTGDLLGSFVSVASNFQPTNMYFMGVASTTSTIGSIAFDVTGGNGSIIGDDFHWVHSPVPAPGATVAMAAGLAMTTGRRRRNA